VLEIGMGTNEKIFPLVLCTFRSSLSPVIPSPETTADDGLWKTGSRAAFDSTMDGV
jgi:hypothetical protein